MQPGLTLAVYSTPALGLIAIFRDPASDEVLRAILQHNADAPALQHTFQFPRGPRLTYELAAPPDRWVMVSDGGRALDRDFERWPLINGQCP